MKLCDKLGKLFGISNKTPLEKTEIFLDIKEPVFAFVKCFKENPKRFKITSLGERPDLTHDWLKYVTYELKDKVTGKSWRLTKRFNDDIEMYLRGRDYPSFLTLDEITFIVREIENYYKNRLNKIYMHKEGLTGFRSKNIVKHRQELMEDYCK